MTEAGPAGSDSGSSGAVEQGKQVAGAAADQGKQVASTAAGGMKDVASTAKEQAGQVASEVSTQGRQLAKEAKQQLSEQARGQTQQIAQALRQLGDRATALAEGRSEEAGPLADYARQAASKVSDLAQQVDQRGFEGVIQDVQDFARRKPGTFLLGAAVAGFAVGRLVRGARDADGSSTSGQTALAPTDYAVPPATSMYSGDPYASPGLQPALGGVDLREQRDIPSPAARS